MSYEEFLKAIAEGYKVPFYYNALIHFTEDILIDISMRNQNRVAADLGITGAKLSNLLPMMKEHRSHPGVIVSEVDEDGFAVICDRCPEYVPKEQRKGVSK